MPDIETTYVVRTLTATQLDDCRKSLPARERWLTKEKTKIPRTSTERYHSPSRTPAPTPPVSFKTESLAGPSIFPSGANEDRYASIGNATHAYLAALPSLRTLTAKHKEAVAARCLSGFSATGLVAASSLVSAGDRFVDWAETTYPAAVWHTEMPVTAPRHPEGQWNGTIDLLLTLADGSVVLIDHKTAPIQKQHCEAKAATFAGQLLSYQDALHALKFDVRSSWIHFPLAGVMAHLAEDIR